MQILEQRRRSNQLISNINAIGFASVLLVLLFVLMAPLLAVKIKELINRGSPKVIYFKVDEHTRYANVKASLDAVRTSGLERVAFLVKKRRNFKPPQ